MSFTHPTVVLNLYAIIIIIIFIFLSNMFTTIHCALRWSFFKKKGTTATLANEIKRNGLRNASEMLLEVLFCLQSDGDWTNKAVEWTSNRCYKLFKMIATTWFVFFPFSRG